MANLPTRNNNPGDLKNPSTGQFDQFSDPTAGFAALKNDLSDKISGNTKTGLGPQSTLQDLASVWAPASDGNDPVQYATNLAQKLKVAPTAPLSSLNVDDLASAIAGNEGYQGAASDSTGGQMTSQQFAEKIKAKYPQYANVDDDTLTQKIIAKYPQYQSQVSGGNPSGVSADSINGGASGGISADALSGSSGNPFTQYATTNSTSNQNPGILSDLSQGKFGAAAGSAIKGVGNFLFPSVGDAYHDLTGTNTKTALQQLGDAGSTALGVGTLIPGLDVFAGAGEAAKAAEGATDVAKAAPGLLSSVGKNAALGAGFGVSGALGQGQTDPTKIAESGLLGAGTGGVLGGIGGVLSDKFSAAGTTAEDRLSTQTNRLKTLQKAFADNSRPASAIQAGTDPISTMSQNDLIKGLKVANGKVDASALTNPQDTGTLDNLIEDHSNQASALVKSMKGGIPLDSFKNAVLDAVANNPAIRDAGDLNRAESEVERRFASYSRSFGDLLPFTAVDGIRAAMNRIYDPAERDVARTIGDTARNYLYNGDGANTALKSLMQNEGELIRAKNFTEKLHGTTVPGGKLHKYIAELIGGAVGAGLGKAVPFGDVVGIPAGAYVGGKLEDMAQGRYFNPSRVGGLLKKAAGNKAAGTMAGLLKVGALRGASSIAQ